MKAVVCVGQTRLRGRVRGSKMGLGDSDGPLAKSDRAGLDPALSLGLSVALRRGGFCEGRQPVGRGAQTTETATHWCCSQPKTDRREPSMASRSRCGFAYAILAGVIPFSACYSGPHCSEFTIQREWGDVLMLEFPRRMVESCLRAGASPNIRNDRGLGPLHYAALMRVEDVEVLLEAGAHANAGSGRVGTPLHFLASFGDYPASVRLLIDAGASVNGTDSYGDTPLHKAAYMGRTEVIEELLRAGASLDAKNIRGETPLHSVALRLGEGRPPRPTGTRFVSDRIEGPLIIEALLAAGANLRAQDSSGRAAVDIFSDIAEYRESDAEEVGPGTAEEIVLGRPFRDCPSCPEMVVVPTGQFAMGSPDSEPGRQRDEGPRHNVQIALPFAVGIYEVTFAEWDACANDGGCGGYRPDDEGRGRQHLPVTNVSWQDAQRYVRWLSVETGEPYRLLSEAEWEYVARAGTRTARYWGESEVEQCRYANGYDDEVPCSDGYAETAPAGSFEPNAYGLYDILGNVFEWTEDCWNESYSGAPSSQDAWQSGDCSERVLRGGSRGHAPDGLRSAFRARGPLGYRSDYNGFRVARTMN